MLILTAKLLLIVFMPLAAVLAWQWRTRALCARRAVRQTSFFGLVAALTKIG